MRLQDLLRDVGGEVTGSAEVEVASVVYDSRQAGPDSLFVAIPGLAADGSAFIRSAIEKGARVIVSEQKFALDKVTHVQVADARSALALIAANFHGRPADHLSIVGVTGTSGKTTTTRMIEAIFDATGEPAGLIGTIEYRAGSHREIADRTTPDAVVLQQWFAKMREEKVTRAVMEVSSHALALKRTLGIHFAAAVFTNLSRDHFDFHKDFEDYFAAKKILFDQIDRQRRTAVVNVDDEYGLRLATELGANCMRFGRGEDCEIRPEAGFRIDVDGLHGRLITPEGPVEIDSVLVGLPNLYNWMGAVGAALVMGVPVAAIESGIRALSAVRGRFERVPLENGPTVLVDYAHKPDALEKLLHAVRELAGDRKVTIVFGCGGDRDQGKRPVMGEISGRLADYTILTSDNPRSESPARIIEEIRAGIESISDAKFEVIEDRREAIGKALASAPADSVVVIAGKGHENYQVIGDQIIHFDDREEVESAWSGLNNTKTSQNKETEKNF